MRAYSEDTGDGAVDAPLHRVYVWDPNNPDPDSIEEEHLEPHPEL